MSSKFKVDKTSNKIIADDNSFDEALRPVLRSELALVATNTFPESFFEVKYPDALPTDVLPGDDCYNSVVTLYKSGVANGLDYETAKIMAAQTVLGAAKMVLESDLTPDQLKVNVCSPGGTTIEAVHSFEEDDLYGIIDKAMAACIAKSKKMSEVKN